MSNELVLIIEDNEKSRRLARDVLAFEGYRTVDTETAEEGIRIARKMRPAIIIMDIHLPGIDGFDALRQLRAEPETEDIPVMAVTASTMNRDREAIIKAGFDGYEPKPINVKSFLAAVHQLVAAGRLKRSHA